MSLADWILEQYSKDKIGLTRADFFEKEMDEEIRIDKRVKIDKNKELTEEQVDDNLDIVLNLIDLTQRKQTLDKENTIEMISFKNEKQSLLKKIEESTTLSNDKGLKRKALQL